MGGSARVDGVPLTGGAENNIEHPRTRSPGGIGQPLETVRRRLISSGHSLCDLVEPAGQSLIKEATGLLQKQACKIAVVGQIKAGKSSFINVFTQQPSLLPTDVNPWTTAVTNLHFRQQAPSGTSARFQFFTDTEWRELVDGGGKIRELTQRLVPGFEPELLRQHVESLKSRAATRLGTDYKQLLGTAHEFDSVNADLLLRYVCSGEFGVAGSNTAIGQYADVTKSADLFLKGGPFEFPVTMIDTPGTNDPFLLRDEITRRSLERADIYIVVLTARQPLSDSDVALLRILRGLHKERILVFINRIDDLGDIGKDLDQVMSFVRERISAEFPGAEIPVIAGSARWATYALDPERPAIERVFQPRSLTYFMEVGQLKREDLVRSASDGGPKRDELRKALFACSGIPGIYHAVSTMMTGCHCAHVLKQLSHCFGEMGRGAENATQFELDQLKDLHSLSLSQAHHTGRQMQKLDNEIRQLQEVSNVIKDSAKNLSDQMRDIIAEEADAMQVAMAREVQNHSKDERDVVIDTLRRGRAPRVWKCEATELRRRLAEVFLASFERASRRVQDLQARVSPELHELMRVAAPNEQLPAEPDWKSVDVPAPALTSLGRFIALELDTPWWSTWWSSKPTAEDRGDEVAELIKTEFETVVGELVHTAQSALEAYGTTTTRWSIGICENVIQSLQKRCETLRGSYQELSRSVDTSADPKTVRDQAQRLGELKTRLQRCQTLNGQLGEISEALERTIHH